MKEHEERQLKMFIPELNKISDVTLYSRGIEQVIMGDGSMRSLLRVDLMTQVDGKPRSEFNSTMFVDSAGQVLKSEQDLFGGVVMYRTTREAAMSRVGQSSST